MRHFLIRIIMTACMALPCVLHANAEELQEVVYLKNGSVIRGTIVEQGAIKSLTIKTVDGNVFFFELKDVEKVTKEPVYRSDSSCSFHGNYDKSCASETPHMFGCRDSDNFKDETYGWERAPRYRGSVGVTTVIGCGDWGLSRIMIHTSHGIQIIPELFVGVGVAISPWFDLDDYWDESETYTSMPVYLNIKGDIHNIIRRNFSPYLDLKLGYNFGDLSGLFFAPEIGCHFYFGHKKFGLGFGIGYHMQRAEITEYWYDYSTRIPQESWYTKRRILSGVSLGVTFDF